MRGPAHDGAHSYSAEGWSNTEAKSPLGQREGFPMRRLGEGRWWQRAGKREGTAEEGAKGTTWETRSLRTLGRGQRLDGEEVGLAHV